MILVTGGAGFIGSNLVRQLNKQGRSDILVVDDLTDGTKFSNLVGLDIADYLDKDTLRQQLLSGQLSWPLTQIEAVFHQGACSATTEWNGKYMLDNNYQYSKDLLHFCLDAQIPFLYASSAAVYGDRSSNFIEEPQYEQPLNVYGYSKQLFDQYVRRLLPTAKSQIVGLRYFNVYGPGEQHKGSMASVAWHLHNQILQGENPKLFEGSDGYPNGGQKRDFVYVDDVAKVNLWLWANPQVSGIFNCGTGQAEPFQTVAETVIQEHKQGQVIYIPFPKHLAGRYQSFTQADLTQLRAVGYPHQFTSVAQGVSAYVRWLLEHKN